jgi:hypothetical protein
MATTNHFRVSVAVLALTLAAAVLILPDSAASAQTSPSGTLDANTLPLECVSAQSCTGLVLADV